MQLPTQVSERYERMVYPDRSTVISFRDVKLEIPSDAVDRPVEIVIERLAGVNRLNPGLRNVTGQVSGYRFKPDGMEFLKKIKITIPYNKNQLRENDDINNIYTYFYNEEEDYWERLERVSIDEKNQLVTSLTNHFTDMINGILVLPNSPGPLSFNPNSIKDIKTADPGTNINLIEPPEANSNGNAVLRYPIELPAGRLGIQPELTIGYNSDGSNDWMGLGWNISLQSISIDTRWGVPRYDLNYETETYLLNRQQLTPLAHRGELKLRSGEKIFHSRIEGKFQKIIRHGNSPASYWWEVKDKSGRSYYYGGTPEIGLMEDAVLAGNTPIGRNIFKWALIQVADSHGNIIDYRYQKVLDSGTGSTNTGANLYLKNIYFIPG